MASETYRQYHLRSGDSELTCWLPSHLATGDWITLREIPDIHWQIISSSTSLTNRPIKRWTVLQPALLSVG